MHCRSRWLCQHSAEISNAESIDKVFGKEMHGYAYSRYDNPTNAALEELVSSLENAHGTLATASGMSALQIHRMIGTGSYETAWYMCTRIRAAMKDEELPKLLGEVEIDETFVGGLKRNMHSSKRHGLNQRGPYLSNKIEVLGAISRKGNVVCQ